MVGVHRCLFCTSSLVPYRTLALRDGRQSTTARRTEPHTRVADAPLAAFESRLRYEEPCAPARRGRPLRAPTALSPRPSAEQHGPRRPLWGRSPGPLTRGLPRGLQEARSQALRRGRSGARLRQRYISQPPGRANAEWGFSDTVLRGRVHGCVEINQCVRCECHRAGVASMAWRTTM